MKETKNLEYLYGIHPVTESLISGKRNIKSIIVAKNLSRDINNIRNLSSGKGLPLEFVEKQCLRKILGHDEHQGICASVSGYPYATIDEILEAWAISDRRAFFLILDSIEDSHNLGAIARTALLCGVHGMFIPEHRSAKITPAASKASSGAVEHLKIAVVSSLNSLIGELKKHSI
ncbi:MAG TPA: TrmH family RNA methyltransferase, partial [bacterium]